VFYRGEAMRFLLFLLLFLNTYLQDSFGQDTNSNTQADICLTSYAQNWSKTQKIIETLKNDLHCWDANKLEQIGDIKSTLHTLFKAKNISVSDIEKPYARLQNLISYCRTSEFLRDSYIPNLSGKSEDASDKMLYLMIGDIYGKESGLEGSYGPINLQKRHVILEKLAKTLEKNTFIASKEQANPCLNSKSENTPVPDIDRNTMTDLLAHSKTARDLTVAVYSGDFSTFESLYKAAVDTLKNPDDYFFFQGGWVMHAIVYEVRKTGAETYTFRVFNSGEGIQYHQSISLTTQSLVMPYVEKLGVTKASVSSKGFLKLLQDINFDTNKAIQDYPKILYNAVAQVLDGTPSTHKPEFEDFLDPQISGSCAYYSIPYYYRSSSKLTEMHEFINVHTQFKFLDEYFYTNEMRMARYDVPYNVAKKSLMYFSESVIGATDRKETHIDGGIEMLVAEKMVEYNEILNRAAIELEKTLGLKKEAEKGNFITRAIRNIFRSPGFSLPSGNIQSSTPSITPSNVKLAVDWNAEPKGIAKDLGGFVKTIGSEIHRSHLSISQNQILKVIQNISLKLPIDHEFWKSVSKDDLESTLYQIRRLSEFYIWSIFDHITYSWSEDRGITPVEYLTQVKFLTVADQIRSVIAETDPTGPLADIPTLDLKSMRTVIDGKNLLIALHDAKWSQEFVKIQDYWNSSSVHDFFSWGIRTLSDHRNFFQSPTEKDAFELGGGEKHWSNELGVPPYRDWRDIASSFTRAQKLTSYWKGLLALDNAVRGKTVRIGGAAFSSSFFPLLAELAFGSDNASQPIIQGALVSLTLFLCGKLTGVDFSDSYALLLILLPTFRFLGYETATPLAFALSMLHEHYLSYQIMGRSYFDLRSLSFITDYFATGNLGRNEVQEFTKNRWDFFQVNNEDSWLDSVKSKFNLGNLQTSTSLSPALDLQCKMNKLFGWHCYYYFFGVNSTNLHGKTQISLDQAFAKSEKKLSDAYSESLVQKDSLKNAKRKEMPSNTLVTQFPTKSEITFEVFRQLGYINDDPQTRIAQTLGYFSENFHLLHSADYRSIFKKLVFDPGLIDAEAKKNPLLFEELAKFCRDHFFSTKEQGDLEFAMYFLRLNQYFSEHEKLQYSRDHLTASEPRSSASGVVMTEGESRVIATPKRSEGGQAISSKFLNSRKELVNLLPLAENDDELKNQIFRDIIRTFLHENTIENFEDMSWFLVAEIYRRIHPLTIISDQDLEK